MFQEYCLVLATDSANYSPADPNYLVIAYLVAAILFILSLGGLSRHESARKGNLCGVLGILIAIGATLFVGVVPGSEAGDWIKPSILPAIWAAIVIGAGIGVFVAHRVQMTSMPQLVAILHSFVGLAAVLVGLSNQLDPTHISMPPIDVKEARMEEWIHKIEIFLGVFIGGITFTGSIVAFGKLDGRVSSKPLTIPGRHLFNLAMVLVCVGLGYWFLQTENPAENMWALYLMTAISFVVGAHLVLAIGGADMPVVVSMLNSYSGWAAAATGFMLKNDLLIITGALVGSSGAILSYIMCAAMNRSFISVILGGFGSDGGAAPAPASSGEKLSYNEMQAEEVAESLRDAKNVVIVPGYGMAVAQAQHPIREISEALKKNGTTTRFAIHPVAGRLPGHMNVLLAEARVPYDVVLEMDEINDDFPDTDVVLVVGANDIVNPSAETDPSSPIYGMPVLQAWKAAQVVILKRSMGTGYSGIDNPLFYNENSAMLFGDAKSSVDQILQKLKS
ncbi:MAG: NAD(P)(+) transhydrogenase (Re/Si-specific) subunit beta [Planctomycetaceae bacterium]|nr:NAD(P)(+) transhydrogenase (Re/Si-specific) subunit beta [Planctomycetaceae bacterium]MCP4464370.1 NAD(P)(+) transhydrogenase (Re/Si-specific) subunit beta [Planctomycetaceae bacterium]MDG1808760.1 NAD(P)(+) transhydrogenase (Re/Si-specific) subunit beta [Pirellulaceae bacterium]